MFTQRCFIRKNTPELKSNLENIGYHRRPIKEKYDKHKFLSVYRDGCYNSCTGNETGLEYYIDCGENEDLFLAIAALRDDSDKNQYITNGKIFMTCEKDDISEFVAIIYDGYHFKNDEERKNALSNRWHKLTVEELIEHFKNK